MFTYNYPKGHQFYTGNSGCCWWDDVPHIRKELAAAGVIEQCNWLHIISLPDGSDR